MSVMNRLNNKISRNLVLKLGLISLAGTITTILAQKRLGNHLLSFLSPSEIPREGESFSFTTVTVDDQGRIISRVNQEAIFIEKIAIEFVYIPGGTFLRGSPSTEKYRDTDENPQQRVRIAPFWISKYPITQAQYRGVMGVNPSYFQGDNLPVEQVSWDDAVKFCQETSKKVGTEIKLPSESQWEYACRARTQTPFSFGETLISDLANYRGTATYANEPPGIFREKTTPVGIFPPNGFGVSDLHGNVWEWCEDTYQPDYQKAPRDGRAWIIADNKQVRVLKGGSWFVDPRNCRSAVRAWEVTAIGLKDLGFRVVIPI